MTEKEKMLSGELYHPYKVENPEWIPAKKKLKEFNATNHWELDKGMECIKDIFANTEFMVLDEAPVTIGSNVVIGSGSVVTKSIPDGVVAAGNPCKVIRQITEEDNNYWKGKEEQWNSKKC